MTHECFIIAGDYVNAISVWKSLKSLDVIGPIFFLNTSGRNMAERIVPKCKVIQGIKNADCLFDFLKSLGKNKIKFLFLTDELYHKALWENRTLLSEMNVIVKIGNSDPSTILNKGDFLNAIGEKTSVPVPFHYSPFEFQTIKVPVFIKFKSSYITYKRVPKGKVVYKVNELDKHIKHLVEYGFNLKDVEIQELLSTESKDNISICGWYEQGFHSFHQTRKVLQHPPKNGNGDVVEYMVLNKKLVDYAVQILKLVDYNGPFEIEFVKERNGEEYKVIEMNPRFWMQHGLIENNSGHLLIARYIGVTPLLPVLRYKYWIYPVISLIQIAKGKFKYIPYFLRKDVYKPISVSQSIRFLFSYLLKL